MIVVTAASGRLGQAVAASLAVSVDPKSVRLAARTPAKLEALARRGFDIVRADYGDRASLAAACAGADSMLLISGEGPNPERIRHHRAAVAAATAAGLRRIVYTSFVNPSPSSKFIWSVAHLETEACIEESGLAFTILRNNQYSANLDAIIARAVATGTFAIPGAKGKVAYVAREDVAAAAAATLIGDDHANTIYQLTGPQALDGFDIAALLSQALGREIEVADTPYDDFADRLRSAQLPSYIVDGLISLYRASEAGECAAVASDLVKLIGRPARSVRDHLAAAPTPPSR